MVNLQKLFQRAIITSGCNETERKRICLPSLGEKRKTLRVLGNMGEIIDALGVEKPC